MNLPRIVDGQFSELIRNLRTLDEAAHFRYFLEKVEPFPYAKDPSISGFYGRENSHNVTVNHKDDRLNFSEKFETKTDFLNESVFSSVS